MDLFLNAIIFQVGLSVYHSVLNTRTVLCGIADTCIQLKYSINCLLVTQSLQLALCHLD